MESFNKIITIALIAVVTVISLVSAAVCALDKSRAKSGGRRISESSLLALSALGGALVMFITMLIIRHKTRHAKFMIGLPLMIIYQAAIVYLIVI